MSVLLCAAMVFAFHVSDAVLLALGKVGETASVLKRMGREYLLCDIRAFKVGTSELLISGRKSGERLTGSGERKTSPYRSPRFPESVSRS